MLFPLTIRIKNLNIKERTRYKKHGPTLYFRDNDFTFVVHNGVLVTVEISRKDHRRLNK